MKFTVAQQQAQAAKIAAKSFMLWRIVNNTIAYILLNKGKRSREHMARQLENLAGPKKVNESISLCNFRSAAKSVRDGSEIFLL